jgi:hypothetical protein
MVIKGKISLFTAVGRVVRGAGRDQVQLQGRVRPGPLAQQAQISRQGKPSLESPFNIITVHTNISKLYIKESAF